MSNENIPVGDRPMTIGEALDIVLGCAEEWRDIVSIAVPEGSAQLDSVNAAIEAVRLDRARRSSVVDVRSA